MSTELDNVRLYCAGRRLYEDMLADIDRAEREILLEVYIFDDDEIGRRFRAALMRQAAAGRQVRLVYDSLGCLNTPAGFFKLLSDAGVQVFEFNPINRRQAISRWHKLDRRNHRKVLVLDSRVAYLGGVNISARLADWEDAHLRLEGTIAEAARTSFEHVWAARYSHGASRLNRRRLLSRQSSFILDGFPTPGFSPMKGAHLSLFSRARRRIWIAHAYLIPDRRTIRVLRKAVRRGVDVRVLVPARSDVQAADWALRHVLGRLLRAGVQVRRLEQPMMHTKAVAGDDHHLIVGSANLNRTSFFRNLEIAVWTRDGRIVKPMVERLNMLWDAAVPYTLDEHRLRRRWHRLLGWLAYRLQSWLRADQAW